MNKLTITLTGPKLNDDGVFQGKVIAAVDTATLELHGVLRPITWTQLSKWRERETLQTRAVRLVSELTLLAFS